MAYGTHQTHGRLVWVFVSSPHKICAFLIRRILKRPFPTERPSTSSGVGSPVQVVDAGLGQKWWDFETRSDGADRPRFVIPISKWLHGLAGSLRPRAPPADEDSSLPGGVIHPLRWILRAKATLLPAARAQVGRGAGIAQVLTRSHAPMLPYVGNPSGD